MQSKRPSLLLSVLALGVSLWVVQASADTKVITVVKPGNQGTIFYVVPVGQATPKKGKINVRLFAPEIMPGAPTVQFVAERLKKKMPLTQIVDEALEGQHDPCDVVKAAIVLGIKPEDLVTSFQKVCQSDPEYKEICTPCIILKCTVEAMRALKEVSLSEMEYGLLLKNLAPITGEIKPQDLATITALADTGIQGAIPYSVPTEAQVEAAKLPQAAQSVADALIKAGADPTTVNDCLKGLGVSETQTMTVPAPVSSPPPGVGGGGQPPGVASPAQ